MASHPFSRITQFALPRLTLLLNHIVSSEPVATAKLQAHAGRTIDLRWESGFSPALPAFLSHGMPAGPWAPEPLRFVITPAGLFEVQEAPAQAFGGQAAADTNVTAPNNPGADTTGGLVITVRLADPLSMARQALRGERPEVKIEGDAALAEVASWMMKNLRWDVQDDVARWMGTGPAELLRTVGDGVRQALQRWRPASGRQAGGHAQQTGSHR
jgi:ubiquinone biosynthesis protein UbiJ